jgi:eukaryotic-like serine/threonine-protein kinase
VNPDRWGQIQDLYHATLERPPSQRAEFLSRACPEDLELRDEVESLLAHEGEADGLLESPVWNHVAPGETSTAARQAMAPGAQLGVYRIAELIGAGGMGEVYRARDTRLGRDVALKLLPAELANDPSRRARFEQEARVVAALNHPNIVAIYDVGEGYLVTELVDGEPLRGAKFGVRKTIEVAAQMAAGLAAAHAAGVVHRDLKPDNILVTREGRVKILDFGLAKMMHRAGAGDETVSELTEPGMVLGTVGYMSPEQIRGAVTDHRSDIFSFGLILYELLSGKRAFRGDTSAEVMTAILKEDAPEAPESAPAWLRQIVAHCLEKEAADRFQSAKDLGFALRQTGTQTGAPRAEPTARWRWAMPAAVAALAVGLATVSLLHFRERTPAPLRPLHFQVQMPEDAGGINLSPDGRKVAFLVKDRLWVQFLESGESHELTANGFGVPFWSPDSRFIGYPSQGKLKKIEATGGPPQTVTDLRGPSWGGGAWSQDGVIVFGDLLVGLFRVPASGGIPVQITALDPARHENHQFCPSFLPDGRHFVYMRGSTDEGKSAIYLGSVDAKPEQQSSKPLVASNSQPVYAPSEDSSNGYLLFVREGTLMAQPFDNRRLEMKGQAAPVAEQVSDTSGSAIFVPFSASANDVLAFQGRSGDRRPTWYDREGKVLGAAGEPGDYRSLALSPDGTRLAVSRRIGHASNIWLLDLSPGGASTRFTFGSSTDYAPVWSPDGSRIIFSSDREGRSNLYQKPVNGVKDEEVLLKSSEAKFASSWSRDGRFLLYQVIRTIGVVDVWVLPLEGDRKPVPFLTTEFNEQEAIFSPDGHWVAYESDESGRFEVYVRPFSLNSAGTEVEAGGKWQISYGSGGDAVWHGDGRELYYRRLTDGRLMAVDIATSPAFRAGPPHPLGAVASGLGGVWDSGADGKRFFGFTTNSGPRPFTVVLNWQSSLKK